MNATHLPTLNSLSIRSADLFDADRISTIYLSSRKQYVAFAPLVYSDEEIVEWITTELIPSGQVTVAVLSDQVQGMIALSREDNIGWIDHLYVDTARLGLGIGAALLEYAKRSLGAPIHLWTFTANHLARKFYEKHGFRVAEFSDGRHNEERCPDVRYEWRD